MPKAGAAENGLAHPLVLTEYNWKRYITVMELNLDATFAALADPTRRAILARLAEGEATVMELAAPFAISQPAISKHLKVLQQRRTHLDRARRTAPSAQT